MRKILIIMIIFLGTSFALNARAGIIIRPVINTGLVGYWDFQEGAGNMVYDKSGKGNNGNINGPNWVWADGKIGKALDFTGDYVDLGNDNSLQITGSMTISAWVYQDYFEVGDDDDYIFAKGVAAPTNGPQLKVTEDCGGKNFDFYVSSNGTSPIYRCSQTTPALDTWYHVVGVFNAIKQTLDIYINGALDNGTLSGTVPASIYNTPDSAMLGYRYNWGYWFGKIDEVRIYNRALGESEIERLYKLSQPKMYAAPKNGLVGYWNFEEGSGNKVGDMSGNGNNGTWSGSGTHWTDGKFGKGGDFNGSGNYVRIIDSNSLHLTDFTLSVWLKAESWSDSTWECVLAKRSGSSTLDWDLVSYYSPKRIEVCIGNNVADCVLDNLNYLPTVGAWHHIVVTKNGTIYQLFDNGTYVGQDTSAVTWIDSDYVDIGSCEAGGWPFTGQIDEVRIYNRALERSEIAILYNSGIQKINSSQNNQLTNGLVGFWSFNGADVDGTDAFDRSGNNNHGVISGATKTIGKVGQALSFDGVDDYISLGDSASLRDLPNTGSGALTFSAWVKIKNNGDYAFLFNKAQSTTTNGWGISIDQWQRLGISLNRATTDFDVTTGNYTLPGFPSDWFYVAITYPGGFNSSDTHIYVNGSEISDFITQTDGEGDYMSDSGLQARVGRNAYSAYANTNIDEVRIYNRALSAEEVRRLYNLGH